MEAKIIDQWEKDGVAHLAISVDEVAEDETVNTEYIGSVSFEQEFQVNRKFSELTDAEKANVLLEACKAVRAAQQPSTKAESKLFAAETVTL